VFHNCERGLSDFPFVYWLTAYFNATYITLGLRKWVFLVEVEFQKVDFRLVTDLGPRYFSFMASGIQGNREQKAVLGNNILRLGISDQSGQSLPVVPAITHFRPAPRSCRPGGTRILRNGPVNNRVLQLLPPIHQNLAQSPHHA